MISKKRYLNKNWLIIRKSIFLFNAFILFHNVFEFIDSIANILAYKHSSFYTRLSPVGTNNGYQNFLKCLLTWLSTVKCNVKYNVKCNTKCNVNS